MFEDMISYKRYRIDKTEDCYLVYKRGKEFSFLWHCLFWNIVLITTSPIILIGLFFAWISSNHDLLDIDYYIKQHKLIGWTFFGKYNSEDEAINAVVEDKNKEPSPEVSFYL